jgi:hypothetical protein
MGGGLSHSIKNPAVVTIATAPRRKMLKEWESWSTVREAWRFKDESDTIPEHDFTSWHFNIWELSYDDYITLTMLILLRFDLPTKLSIDIREWALFMIEVERLMTVHMNPYHNYTHIVDVLHAVSVILFTFTGAEWLSDVEVFALILSAIVHDLEHPGTNNPYHVNSSSPLAIRYNDIAVLESYHCAKAFEVFHALNMGIFNGITADQRKYIRKIMISAVLSTDMTTHFALKDELDSLTFRVQTDISKFPVNEKGKHELPEKDKLTLMKSILHVCDISNPAKPWEISKKWSGLVIEEFFAQGDLEKRQNLPVSMNCDRLTTNQDELSINFNDFIVAPFIFSITKFLPEMLPICKILEVNRSSWNTMLAQRISKSAQGDAAKVDDILGKWELRTTAFAEKMRGLEASILPVKEH